MIGYSGSMAYQANLRVPRNHSRSDFSVKPGTINMIPVALHHQRIRQESEQRDDDHDNTN